MIRLSERMMAMAGLALKGEGLADIGTDHGLIPIYLAERHICSPIILTDIAEGPLSRAADNAGRAGVSGLVCLRLGPGLSCLAPGEVSTVIIGGMGGELIGSILEEDLEKSRSFKRFVLQPRTRPEKLRRFLRDCGIPVTAELLAREAGRICEIITAEPGADRASSELFENDMDLLVPPLLFKHKDPLLGEHLDGLINNANTVLSNLERSVGTAGQRSAWSMRLSRLTELKESL